MLGDLLGEAGPTLPDDAVSDRNGGVPERRRLSQLLLL